MFVLNDKTVLQSGKSWTDDNGLTHPSNWASAWSVDDKAAYGIKEVSIQTKPDEKFYWVTGPALDGSWTSTEKNLNDVTQTVLGEDVTTKGLKSEWINRTKNRFN